MHKCWYCQVVLLLLVAPSPTLKQWAWWKDQGLLMFPAFSFLPIRMKAEFFTVFPPLCYWLAENTPPHRKRCSCNVTACTCECALREPGWVKGCQGMVPRLQSGWSLGIRVLRGWDGSQAWENKTVFFQHGQFKSSLTFWCVCSTPASQPSHRRAQPHTLTPERYLSK